MRTTLNIDDAIARQAKVRAAEEGKTLTRFIEDALRAELAHRHASRPKGVEIPVFPGGVNEDLDWRNNARFRDQLEEMGDRLP